MVQLYVLYCLSASALGMVERLNWACAVLPETSQFFFIGANIASFWSNEDTQCEISRVFMSRFVCNENGPCVKECTNFNTLNFIGKKLSVCQDID